ncbi:MAG: RidA family protein [Balneolaceae bacterium]|nr:RidA family protein [Balneolaceae bacterium]
MNKQSICFLLSFSLLTGCIEVENETNYSDAPRKAIHTEDAPGSVGIYSQAIQKGNTLYLSGQIGLIPGSRDFAGEDVQSQTRQALTNIQKVLEAAEFELSDVVEATIFISEMDDYQAFNEAYKPFFPKSPPARAVVEVARLPLDAKVEIKVSAVR